MLTELLSHLSPDTIIAIIADLEAGCDERFPNSDATRRLLPPFKRQLVALVGEDEAAALLAANAIDPNIGEEVIDA